MPVQVSKELCCYCGACVAVCPVPCLELKETRIEVEQEKCIKCKACERVCPVGAVKVE